MNYGGHYRDTPERLATQAQAEDLNVVYNLIVNKEERVPDVGYFRASPDPATSRRSARSTALGRAAGCHADDKARLSSPSCSSARRISAAVLVRSASCSW